MSWPTTVINVNKFHYPRGGSERYYFDLTRILDSRGHRVVSFSMTRPENEPSPHAEHFVGEIRWEQTRGWAGAVTTGLRVVHSREASRRIERLLSVEGGDLAHLHNISHQLTPSILGPLKRRGLVVVQTLHDYKLICPNYRLFTEGAVCERCRGGRYWNAFRYRCGRGGAGGSFTIAVEAAWHRLSRAYERGIDLFLAPSRFLMEKAIEFGVPAERVRHLPNPVSLSAPEAGAIRESPRSPARYFLYLGRLSPEKGIGTLLAAMARVPEAELRIAGDGELRRALSERAASLPGVSLLGHRPRAEIDRLLRGAIALVMPSEWYENNPLALLEAFAAGVPVIASDIGGLPELVEPGRSGWLFPPGDAEALADSLREAIRASDRRRAMGREGRRRVEESHGAERHYSALMEAYGEARGIAQRGRPWRWRKAS